MYMHYIPCRYMTSRPKIDLHGRHACMHGIYACIHDGSCCDDRQMIMHIQLHACMHACTHSTYSLEMSARSRKSKLNMCMHGIKTCIHICDMSYISR